MAAIHFIVSGKVQGVYYRQSAKKEADKLGITGWVRNNSDGTVEGVAVGEQVLLDEFITWCNKGPLLAHVKSVVTKEGKDEKLSGFEIRRD